MIKLSYDPSYLGSEGADKNLNFASTTGKTPTISPLLHVFHTAYVSLATHIKCGPTHPLYSRWWNNMAASTKRCPHLCVFNVLILSL